MWKTVPGLSSYVLGKFDDELHADSPLALMMAFGHAELLVECASDGADGAIAHDGESARGCPCRACIRIPARRIC